MASKPVRFHPEDEQEYLSSLAWYKERSPAASFDFESEFQRAMSAIAETPNRWPIYFSPYRRYFLHQFPFAIVYSASQDEVLVLAVAHGHRKPGYGRKRALG
jgi:toxin ParE2